jgi:predicted phosphodiesterase
MRWLLISDIHANLPALESVLKRASQIGYDRIMCAGDIVGYYPWANEVCDWVRENVDLCVMGNHDAIIAGLVSPEYFNGWARTAILWTMEHLTETNKEFIKNLPLKLEFPENNCLVHDTPVAPMSMYYITDPYDAVEVFRKTDYRITVYGHTHIPAAFVFNGAQVMGIKPKDLFPLRGDWRYLINPGSVGQPRDGVPKASFAVWDTDESVIYFERVEFDIDAVVKKMKEVGLPLELAYRLYEGY